jgi:hypothetical protein
LETLIQVELSSPPLLVVPAKLIEAGANVSFLRTPKESIWIADFIESWQRSFR